MLNRLKRPKFFCGVDIGASSVKAALVHVRDEHNLDLLGVFEVPAKGFKDASVNDLTELADCIQLVVKGVSQKCAVNVTSVHLGIDGECLQVRRSSAVLPLVDTGTKVISRSDVRKVNHQARLLGTGLEEEVLHDVPQFYKVDDANVATNPIGLFGRKLESHLLLFLVNANRLRNMVKAVHQAGYEVGRVSLSAWAASVVGLEEALKRQGCVLVDIGSNLTTVLFFKNNILGDVQSVPWGGQYLTQSLAERLNLAADLAEDIKRTHAVASVAVPAAGGDILVKRDKGYLPVRREAVCEAVNWEVENLLTHLETVIHSSPLFHDLNGGVVVVGGGALLPGLMERIEARLRMPVRMGTTKGLNNAALFSSAIGLAQLGYMNNLQQTVDFKTPGEVKHKLIERVRELCQEYF